MVLDSKRLVFESLLLVGLHAEELEEDSRTHEHHDGGDNPCHVSANRNLVEEHGNRPGKERLHGKSKRVLSLGR